MKKKFLLIGLVIATLCALVAMSMLGCAASEEAVAEATTDGEFKADDELIIGHVTDTHYFPLALCYSGDIAGTDYETDIMTQTKLIVENHATVIQGLSEMKLQEMDYLIVAGDVTHNGELQAHMEMSNMLRKLQNEVRAAGNEDFQIFVVPGNHDMYNPKGTSYRNGGNREYFTHYATRYDFTKLYASLGYPDLSDAEIADYYNTISDAVYYDHLPYEGQFINSTTASNITIEYQYRENGYEGDADYDNGEIGYIAYAPDNYVFIAIDEELSNAEVLHDVGGKMYDSTREYLLGKKSAGKFTGKTLIGIAHHNVVPHFKGEEALLKAFTLYGWEESCDFLADLGIRYLFSGHMHSADLVSHTSFNGNPLTDIETSSLIGYQGGTRYAKLSRGSLNGDYAENFEVKMDYVDSVDLSYIYNNGYINDEIFEFGGVNKYIEKKGNKVICTQIGNYMVQKVFLNITNNLKYKYLNVDTIGGLGDTIQELLSSGINIPTTFKGVVGLAGDLVDNLIAHLEDVVLADYTYSGTNEDFKSDVRGAKLCGYAEELVDRLCNIKVNTAGDTLYEFGLGQYIRHVGGLDVADSALTDAEREAFENLTNGSIVKEMLDVILSKESGLYRIVIGLTEPIDLAKDMSDSSAKSIATILKLLTDGSTAVDAHAVVLDDLMAGTVKLLESLGVSLPLTLSDTIQETIDHILDDFITDSFYTSLGEIAHDILYSFGVDETSAIENNPTFTLYKSNSDSVVTYLSTAEADAPSVENGKLPEMITVSFGADPKTQKNFVWFTDRRVTGTQIQYSEGEFDVSTAITVDGEYAMYATTTPSIDLGVYATLMNVETGRHSVELKGLKAGTTYSYRVGSAADGYWSDVATFKTAPEGNEAFEILLITDIQGSALATYKQSNEIMSKMSGVFENGYDFIINCGDVVDNSRNDVQWGYFLNTLSSYWTNTTQVVAAGNHDKYYYEGLEHGEANTISVKGVITDEAYNYLLFHYGFDMPEQDTTTGAYYSFDYSGVHFTVLNTNDLTKDNMMSDAQVEWLKKDLAATDKIKVVVMHKGLYSSGSHSTESDVVNMRAQLTSVFAENGVHLVLSGHDHTYSETYYLDKDGKRVETDATGGAKIGEEGTLYITLGTFGDKFYNYVDNENVDIEFGKDLHNPNLTNPTFGKLVYDGESLYYYGYEYDLDTQTVKSIRGTEWQWWYYLALVGLAIVPLAVVVTVVAVSIKNCKKSMKK